MSVVTIAYFSGYGHTARQAEAVAEGVRLAGSTAKLLGKRVAELARKLD